MEKEVHVDMNKKAPLVMSSDEEDFTVTKDKEDIVNKEVDESIPSQYIAIHLPSDGKFEGIPKILHFREYTASESLDLNTANPEKRSKALGDVLTRLCWEKFNILDLSIQDVIYILHVIHATFISPTITKEIYLDETLPEGNGNGELDNPENIEEVDIPVNKLNVTYFGKDENDNPLKKQIKIPFVVKDKKTNDEISFKLVTLRDTITAQSYVDNFYSDEFLKFASIRKDIDNINSISDSAKRHQKMEEYMDTHYDEAKEYQEFMELYTLMTGKVLQALQIVSYNGKKLESLTEQWEVYTNKISASIWKIYNKIVEDFHYGINNKVEVYSSKLNKKLERNISFQYSDFLSISDREELGRYDVVFD